MVAGELADLAGEAYRTIGKQDLGLAHPAGMQQDLAGCRIARRILVADPEIEPTQWDPAGFAAPAHMDDALTVRQHRLEPLAAARRGGALKPGHKREASGCDANILHCVPLPVAFEKAIRCRGAAKRLSA